MKNDPEQLRKLFRQYLDNSISKEDYVLFWHLYQTEQASLDSELKLLWQQSKDCSELVRDTEWDMKIRDLIKKAEDEDRIQPQPASGIRKLRSFFPYAAAAILLLAVFSIYWFSSRPEAKVESRNILIQQPVPLDISPGSDLAQLTLSDGKTIVLNPDATGSVALEGGMQVINDHGKLIYIGNSSSNEILYNIVTTPRGGQYHLILPDGSKVWLNSASSLRFPIVFREKERRVELTGEGYFEVVSNKASPFRVQKDSTTVEALGTRFNVNVYEDENSMRVTLLEGKVNVRSERSMVIIKAGTQAEILPTGQMVVNHDINLAEVMAWKDGFFKFNNTDIQTMMRQAARWYDIDVKYPQGIPVDTFTGSLPRKVTLLQFLKILEYSDVQAGIQGRTVIIKR